MRILTLLLLSLPAAAQNTLPIQDFAQEGSEQAVQKALDDKFSVSGGTIAGTVYISTALWVNGSQITGGATASTGSTHVVFVTSITCAYWSRRGTAIPADDTVPQISEGWGVLTATITFRNANSQVLIVGRVNATEDSNVGDYGAMTLFKDGAANAIQASNLWAGGDAGSTEGPAPGVLFHFMTAGDTNQHYFTLNIGCNVSNCLGANDRGAARMYGGTQCSDLTVFEFLP